MTITTAALASTRSPSRTSERIVNDRLPRWPTQECTAYGSRAVGQRREVVDVGAGDDVLAPVLAARVQVHQVADPGLLDVLEEHTGARLAALVEVRAAHGELVDVAGRAGLVGAPGATRGPARGARRRSARSASSSRWASTVVGPQVDGPLRRRRGGVVHLVGELTWSSLTSVTQESTSTGATAEDERAGRTRPGDAAPRPSRRVPGEEGLAGLGDVVEVGHVVDVSQQVHVGPAQRALIGVRHAQIVADRRSQGAEAQ